MTELVGDLCLPSELIIPTNTTTSVGKAGFIFVSGGKLYFDTGSAIETITSA
jgi:hypothetical protein